MTAVNLANGDGEKLSWNRSRGWGRFWLRLRFWLWFRLRLRLWFRFGSWFRCRLWFRLRSGFRCRFRFWGRFWGRFRLSRPKINFVELTVPQL
jgi:hypothetical protein